MTTRFSALRAAPAAVAVTVAGCLTAELFTPNLIPEEQRPYLIEHPLGEDCVVEEFLADSVDDNFLNVWLLLYCDTPPSERTESCRQTLANAGLDPNAQLQDCPLIERGDDAAVAEAKRRAAICHYVNAPDGIAETLGLDEDDMEVLFDCGIPARTMEQILTDDAFDATLASVAYELPIASATITADAEDFLDQLEAATLRVRLVNHDSTAVSIELRASFATPENASDARFYEGGTPGPGTPPDPVGAMDAFWRSYGLLLAAPAGPGAEATIELTGKTVSDLLQDAFDAVEEGEDATLNFAFFNQEPILTSMHLEVPWIVAELSTEAEGDGVFPLHYLFY